MYASKKETRYYVTGSDVLVTCNWPIRDAAGPIKGGILSNKLRVVRTLETTPPCLFLHLGTKDGTWDHQRGDDNRGTRQNRK